MAASAVENYNTLANCNSTISEACNVPSTTFNTTILTKLQECHQLFTSFKTVSAGEFLVGDWLAGWLAGYLLHVSTLQTAGLQILITVLSLAPAGLTPI